jgi:putative spermidine/putrescine transport system ATP-binding protein
VMTIGTGTWTKADAANGPATAVVRPEKIALGAPAADRLTGTVRLRVFQGNHWLYQIETAAGPVLVIRQNAGEPGPAEDEMVGLTWRAEDMVVRPRRKEPA